MKPIGPLTSVHRTAPRGGGHVNVTPLIDIVMVLIVFYLLVGHLAMDRRGELELPESSRGEAADAGEAPIAIVVHEDGSMSVEAVETPPEVIPRMLEVLIAQKPGRAVQIRADKGAPFSRVRAALDACRKAGVAQVQLAARARENAG